MVDAIVLGLGAMGSATAYQLAQRGKRVLGLEQFTPAHDRGSSHGSSRVIRQAYYEHPDYVPLLLRSYDLWERLERDTRSHLLHKTGGLMIGAPESSVVQGSIESARHHGLRHEIFDAAEIHRRFPPLCPQSHEVALYEYKAGYLIPEASIRQHLKEAARFGADLHFEEAIESWKADGRGGQVVVKTAKASYEAEQLVICSGAWAPEFLSSLGFPLVVTRQVMFWFDPIGGVEPFLPDRFPIYVWQPPMSRPFYGFPSLDGEKGGVKVAIHGSDNVCTPRTINRAVSEQDLRPMQNLLATRIPSLSGMLVTSKTCMYTMTPDENFVVGPHPEFPNVQIAAGFSGHGFKFSSVMGEILADLATEGATRHKIGMFANDRFKKAESGTRD
jgi:sarcosine oxidase